MAAAGQRVRNAESASIVGQDGGGPQHQDIAALAETGQQDDLARLRLGFQNMRQHDQGMGRGALVKKRFAAPGLGGR